MKLEIRQARDLAEGDYFFLEMPDLKNSNRYVVLPNYWHGYNTVYAVKATETEHMMIHKITTNARVMVMEKKGEGIIVPLFLLEVEE